MSFKLRNLVAATLAGSLLMSFGVNAMADSTDDIVNALVSKGVLTEEEGALLMKGREGEKEVQAKAMKKASRLTVSDVIDNATLYGDMRARIEYRDGEDARLTNPTDEERTRDRYKLTFGVKTTAGDFYSDLAFAMGSGGRSDNATFGSGTNGSNTKEALFVKRAMLGWNVTDWLAVEAGRVANPLYTTSMVWDSDLTFEGLVEKVKYKVGDVDLFGNFVQSKYIGDKKSYSGTGSTDRTTTNILAFQGGAKFKIADDVSAKAALTYTTYSNGNGDGRNFAPTAGNAATIFSGSGTSVNDLKTIEIPLEINFKTAAGIGLTAFGDYVHNLDGDDRKDAACLVNAAICNAGGSSNAWLLGFGADWKQDKKAKKGDWSAKIWYQDVGVYALDPNAVDSDFMDSRVNMKGIVLKAEYGLRDNVFLNLAAGHAKRKDNNLSAAGSTGDIATSAGAPINIDKYNLYQLDVTYKF